MQKSALLTATLSVALLLAGCGGGGTSGPLAGGTSTGGGQSQSILTDDLFNLNGSDLLNTLELDAGFLATSSRTASSLTPARQTATSGSFVFQATGGTATIARSGGATSPAIGFLMTYRDAAGLCECSNDNTALPKPYATTISNPLWLGGQPFPTRASTTTLGIAYKSKTNSADHGGTYAAAVVPNPPGGTTTFTIPNGAVSLPRQSAPNVAFAGNASPSCPVGSAYVSWTPAAGTSEYFIAFLTHLNNDPVHNPGFNVVGFVVTNGTDTCVAGRDFYSKAQYQALVIASDVSFIGVYDSQGVAQAPKLPSQIDFSVSRITTFTTP